MNESQNCNYAILESAILINGDSDTGLAETIKRFDFIGIGTKE
ncbi:hypothetical protein [Spirosoma aureum]|nr:hypothetical protein [Spirosoma aureum]